MTQRLPSSKLPVLPAVDGVSQTLSGVNPTISLVDACIYNLTITGTGNIQINSSLTQFSFVLLRAISNSGGATMVSGGNVILNSTWDATANQTLSLLWTGSTWLDIGRNVSGSSGAPADATYVTLSTNGTLTNERVLTAGTGITLTDAGAGSTITASLTGTGSGSAFVQAGNSFAATAVLGTNDANSLSFETNNTVRATLDTSGNLLLSTSQNAGTYLSITNANTGTAAASAITLTESGATTIAQTSSGFTTSGYQVASQFSIISSSTTSGGMLFESQALNAKLSLSINDGGVQQRWLQLNPVTLSNSGVLINPDKVAVSAFQVKGSQINNDYLLHALASYDQVGVNIQRTGTGAQFCVGNAKNNSNLPAGMTALAQQGDAGFPAENNYSYVSAENTTTGNQAALYNFGSAAAGTLFGFARAGSPFLVFTSVGSSPAIITNGADLPLIISQNGSTGGRITLGTAGDINVSAQATTSTIDSNAANTVAILSLENTAGDFQFFRTDATPEAAVTGSIGDLAVDGTAGIAYIKNSGSATNAGWLALASSATAGLTQAQVLARAGSF